MNQNPPKYSLSKAAFRKMKRLRGETEKALSFVLAGREGWEQEKEPDKEKPSNVLPGVGVG